MKIPDSTGDEEGFRGQLAVEKSLCAIYGGDPSPNRNKNNLYF